MHHIAFVLISALSLSLRRPNAALTLLAFMALTAWALAFQPNSWDFRGFELYFECATTSTCYTAAADDVEPSFRAVASLVSLLMGPYSAPAIVAIYSITAIAIKIWLFRKEAVYFGVAVFTYLCFGFFLHDVTQVRAGLAIALLWLAMYMLLTQRAYFLGAILMGASVLIHNSTAVMLAVLPLTLIRIRFVWLAVLLVSSIAAGLIFQDLLKGDLATFQIPFDPRIASYLAASRYEILVSPQFSVFGLCIAMIVVTIGLFVDQSKFTPFERGSFVAVTTGLMLYHAIFWLPIIGLRTFDVLASFLPFVCAAVFRLTPKLTPRLVMLLGAFGIFFNSMVRNGLMLNFVLEGQAQEANAFGRGTN